MLSSPLFTSPMMGSALKKPINVDGPVAMNVVENCFQLSIALGSLFVADKTRFPFTLKSTVLLVPGRLVMFPTQNDTLYC